MSQIKEVSFNKELVSVEKRVPEDALSQKGQHQGINEIFESMQKNFDKKFDINEHNKIQEITTERIISESNKQITQSSRSNRKLKPIYSTLVKHQSSSNNQNSNSDSKSILKSTDSNPNQESNQQQTTNLKFNSNQSEQTSNKNSPYAQIKHRLHHSAVTEFYPHQDYSTSISNFQTQKKNLKINQNNPNHDESSHHQSPSSKTLNYKDLQQKIQSALKKNSHYKAFGSSRLNHSNLTSRTFNQFNELLLSRFQQYEKNRERQIQQKKFELQQRNSKQLKFHPKINKKSIQFIQQMGGHQPIQNRYQKIMEVKKQKFQKHQEQKRQKEEREHEKFMEEFLKHQKTRQQKTRSYDKFYQEMLNWKQRSIKNTEEKKKLMQENILKQTSTFNPKINKKSSKIVMNSTKSEKYLPIHERQIPAQKKFKSKIDEECTFKPKINKRKIK